MSNTEEALTNSYNSLIKVAGTMLKVAQDGEATPQDVIEVLDEVTAELEELRQSVPGGSQGEEQEQEPEEKEAPPGQKKEPAEKGAKTEIDTAEESREKVNEQNAAQLALKNKTYSMTAKEYEENQNTIKSLKARLDELESEKSARERQDVATAYSELFLPHQRKAKFDEVINSQEPTSVWEDRITTIEEFNGGNSVKPAKTQSGYLPIKTAKQKDSAGARRFL